MSTPDTSTAFPRAGYHRLCFLIMNRANHLMQVVVFGGD